jgi:hypothetical protein
VTELAETEAQPEQEPLDDVDAAERLPAEIELGFSVQLCTLRWRGHFLPDTRDVPAAVLEVLAPQLGLLPMLLADYPRDEKTRWAHLERIRRHLGFVRRDRAQRQHLLDHLISVARNAPRPETLRRAAHAWLLEQHVVRPRRTTLRDLVASAREIGLQHTYDALARDLSELQRSRLDGLLTPAETPVDPNESPKVFDDETADEPRSRLDRFKVPPRRESPAIAGHRPRQGRVPPRALATGYSASSGGTVEGALVKPYTRSPVALFARFEHEADGTRQSRPTACQQPRGANQHRGVGIMAAGVHAAGRNRSELKAGVLL